MHKGLLTTKVR